MIDNQERLIPEFIKYAIEKQIERITDEEFKEAEIRIKERRSEAVAQVMLWMEKRMSIEKIQDTYKFIIEIKDEK